MCLLTYAASCTSFDVFGNLSVEDHFDTVSEIIDTTTANENEQHDIKKYMRGFNKEIVS